MFDCACSCRNKNIEDAKHPWTITVTTPLWFTYLLLAHTLIPVVIFLFRVFWKHPLFLCVAESFLTAGAKSKVQKMSDNGCQP